MSDTISGGCYCGAVRYEAKGDPVMKGLCCCRECQYISGGMPNVFVGMPGATFQYTKGTPRAFKRKDLEQPVTREFCGDCGAPLATISPGMPDVKILKAGSLDKPAFFDAPQFIIFTKEKQPFHILPEGVRAFETLPDR